MAVIYPNTCTGLPTLRMCKDSCTFFFQTDLPDFLTGFFKPRASTSNMLSERWKDETEDRRELETILLRVQHCLELLGICSLTSERCV